MADGREGGVNEADVSPSRTGSWARRRLTRLLSALPQIPPSAFAADPAGDVVPATEPQAGAAAEAEDAVNPCDAPLGTTPTPRSVPRPGGPNVDAHARTPENESATHGHPTASGSKRTLAEMLEAVPLTPDGAADITKRRPHDGGHVAGAPVGRSLRPAPVLAVPPANNVPCAPIYPGIIGTWAHAGVQAAPVDHTLELHMGMVNADRALRPSAAREGVAMRVFETLKGMLDEVFAWRDYLEVVVLTRDERGCGGLDLNGCEVAAVDPESCWHTGGLQRGMKIIAINGKAVTARRDVLDLLAGSGTTVFHLEVDTRALPSGAIPLSHRVTLTGSWASDTHLASSPLDVIINVPRSKEWTTRLAACAALRYSDVFTVETETTPPATQTDTHARLSPAPVPDLRIIHTRSGLVCRVHMARQKASQNTSHSLAASLAPECKKVLRVLKAMNKMWGGPATSYQLTLLVQAYHQTITTTDMGWFNDTNTLGSLLMGLLHWYGAVFDWKTSEVYLVAAATSPGYRTKSSVSPSSVILCPVSGRNVVCDQRRFAAFVSYMARSAAVLANSDRTLDHVLPRGCCV